MEARQPTPIKTTLFRFLTLRNPQLISEKKREWEYIYHPDPISSYFLRGIITLDLVHARKTVTGIAAGFAAFDSVKQIRDKFNSLYVFSCWLSSNASTLVETEVNARINSVILPDSKSMIDIWDNLFCELVLRENAVIRQACIQLIIANNFVTVFGSPSVKTIAEELIQTPKDPLPPAVELRLGLFMRRVANAMIVVPKAFSIGRGDEGITTTTPNTTGSLDTDVKLYGINKLGVAVLRRVEQEVCCYVPGEVSRIENILAREYKERQTRSLISTETTIEKTSETEIENQSDTVSTTRNELQSEIAHVLTKNSSFSMGVEAGVNVSSDFIVASGSLDVKTSLDFASAVSSTTSDSMAQTYAQEVTNSALERVLQKTSEKRTSRVLQEYEENNRHGFDNREGTEHVTGVYRWVDIIYKNSLVNYGKRLMLEFLIPEPAKFYKEVLAKRYAGLSGGVSAADLVVPINPSDKNLKGPDYLIGYLNNELSSAPIGVFYQEIAAFYGVELTAPPPQVVYVEQTLSQAGMNKDHFAVASAIMIPEGYRCKSGKCLSVFSWEPNFIGNSAGWYVQVGPKCIWRKDRPTSSSTGSGDEFDDNTNSFEFDNYLTASVMVSVNGDGIYSFQTSVVLQCEIVTQVYENWQTTAYKKIMDAYEAQVRDYEEAYAAAEKMEDAINHHRSNNEGFNRKLEHKEIKRISIEMLTKPFGILMGGDFYYRSKECDVPLVNQGAKWRKYAATVKFFEQAFEWRMMGYRFYPYYWCDKCDWADLFETDPSGDPVFASFLQSGMARAVISVTPGYEKAVNYYLETGDIWNGGGLVMDTDDDLYISVDGELQEIEGVVEETWETRIPTTLTIVQGKSVYLEDEGLPCCEEVENENMDTLLRSSSAILGNQKKMVDQ